MPPLTERDTLDALVRDCFNALIREEDLTHGKKFELYALPNGQCVFQLYGASGGLRSDYCCYLMLAPGSLTKGSTFSNSVRVLPSDGPADLFGRLGVEIARLEGYAHAKLAGPYEEQPRLTKLDGGDLGAAFEPNNPLSREALQFIDSKKWGPSTGVGKSDLNERLNKSLAEKDPEFAKRLEALSENFRSEMRDSPGFKTMPASTLVPPGCHCQKRYGHREHALDCPFK